MKKLFFLQLLLLLFAMPLVFIACDDNAEEPEELFPKLDGFYIYGTNTVASSAVEPAARMNRAVLDHGKVPNVENQEGVYGKFLYIGANSKIKFAEVKNEVATSFGAADGGTRTNGLDVGNVQIDDIVIHGTLTADASEINITEEGLYYAFVNVNTGFFVIVRVKANMIGDTTPGNWATATPLPQKFVSKDSAVFELTGVTLKGESGYRYRFNEGWHFYIEENVTTTMSSLGVLSYGDSWALPANDIGFFLDNAPHQTTGIFTVKLKYIAATDEWVEKKKKTGDVLVDYSDYNMSIIGSAIEGTSWNGDGTGGHGGHVPVKAGTVYTWTWNDVAFIDEGEFIFLRNATWGQFLLDFPAATTVNGTAVAGGKIVNADLPPINGDPNFHVLEAGTFDVKVVINAQTNTRTVTIDNN